MFKALLNLQSEKVCKNDGNTRNDTANSPETQMATVHRSGSGLFFGGRFWPLEICVGRRMCLTRIIHESQGWPWSGSLPVGFWMTG